MKKIIIHLSIATLAVLALSMPLLAGDACCSGGDSAPQPAQAAKQDAAQTQKYTCPMHSDVVSDKPGKCPKCGMTLVPVKDAK
jgi:hypothetical protein